VKYYVFAQIFALCRPINLPNPIRQLYTSGYSTYSCLIGLVVVLTGRLSAINLAKSLIVSEKDCFNHRASMQWNGSFRPKILPSSKLDWSDTQEQRMLFNSNQGIELPPTESICWVVLLIICWNFEYVNSLSLRDTHRFKKAKYWNIAHLSRYKRNIASVECSSAHRSGWYM
jgi:hypothetical protein